MIPSAADVHRAMVTNPDGTYTTEYVTSHHGDPVWEAIWAEIRRWDIHTPQRIGYSRSSGDDVTRIFEAIAATGRLLPR